MHSVTTDLREAKLHFVEVTKAIEIISNDFFIFAFIPNTDPGRNYILKKLKISKEYKNFESSQIKRVFIFDEKCKFYVW